MRHLHGRLAIGELRLDPGAKRCKAERAFDFGRDRPGNHRPRKATSSSVARRRPRPGREEIASIRLVLPAPFGPTHGKLRVNGERRRADSCENL